MSRYVNPWRLWTGAFVPEWLMRQHKPSPGAKLAYARLCRFAGKEGTARPFLDDLADELGVDARTARRYTKELATLNLVEIEQRGLGLANLYRFPEHEWMGLDSPDTSVPSRTDTSVRSRRDTTVRSGEDTSDRSERTHSSVPERTDLSVPSIVQESVIESQGKSHSASELETALEQALGHGPETRGERAKWADAVTQLVAAGATPLDVERRVAVYRRRWPDVACTPHALISHWGELGARRGATSLAADRPDCARCGGSGWLPSEHDAAGARISERCPDCNPLSAGNPPRLMEAAS